MKKRFAGLLTGILAVCMTGNVYAADLVDMEPKDGASVTSYLTGESVSEAAGLRRPVAIMMGNNRPSVPQSGISRAGVIYEAPVEGNMTRLMAIYEDYDSLEKIGSVRSCRHYYLFYANEFDAIYGHFGQAVYALPYLEQGFVDNLNGLAMEGTAYFRIPERKAPHNAYASGDSLKKGIEQKGYRTEYKDGYEGHYLFAEEGTDFIPENGTAANIVRLDNFTDNHPWFEYDQNTKEYSRYQYGEAQIDEATGEQLTCDNILLQYSDWKAYDDNGYLNIDPISGGSGKYITRGKAMDITWQKDEDWGITHYYDMDGNEIHLNRGKTWVEIVLDNTVDSIIYE